MIKLHITNFINHPKLRKANAQNCNVYKWAVKSTDVKASYYTVSNPMTLTVFVTSGLLHLSIQ